jgi:hypothetical protein
MRSPRAVGVAVVVLSAAVALTGCTSSSSTTHHGTTYRTAQRAVTASCHPKGVPTIVGRKKSVLRVEWYIKGQITDNTYAYEAIVREKGGAYSVVDCEDIAVMHA